MKGVAKMKNKVMRLLQIKMSKMSHHQSGELYPVQAYGLYLSQLEDKEITELYIKGEKYVKR